MMDEFRFASPWFLLLVIPVVWLFIRSRKGRATAVTYSDVRILQGAPVTLRQRAAAWFPWLKPAGVFLLIIGLSRPQFGEEEFRIYTEGLAIQMCIDRSGSMQALDFFFENERINRLQAVKKVFRDFVSGTDDFDGRPYDLIGLIRFGGYAEAVCPPTLDHEALLTVMESVETPTPVTDDQGRILNEELLREEQATAIGDALALAVDRLRNTTAESRIVILLSDGENNSGVITPEDAARAAREFGVRVYTIGIGQSGYAPFPAIDIFGRERLQMQQVRLDEVTLQQIAETTGGRYFHAEDTDSLISVCSEIDTLEKTEIEGDVYQRYEELYGMPTGAGILLLLTGVCGEAFWIRRAV